jgi:hypothetical protein
MSFCIRLNDCPVKLSSPPKRERTLRLCSETIKSGG